MNTIILHCRKNCIEAVSQDKHGNFGIICRFTTEAGKKRFLKRYAGHPIFRSSDMDFPEQYTTNKRILALTQNP